MSVIPFFPLDDSIAAGSNASESPTTIQQRLPVEPTFDPENCSKPLGDYDALHFNQNYPEFCVLDPDASTGLPDMPPAIAVDVGDNFYLAPTLTSNERLRLNTLWYYTKNLYSNANLLASIQVKVDMLREFTGWDMAICGFIDNSTFRRVVTAGVELRVLPRRESTCSHTIQGKAPGVRLAVSLLYCPGLSDHNVLLTDARRLCFRCPTCPRTGALRTLPMCPEADFVAMLEPLFECVLAQRNP